MAHAHLGQQLAKAAPLGGQLAHQGGAAHGKVGGQGLECMVGAGLHPEVAGQPLPERHCVGGKQQVEGMGGVQLGIESVQQLDLGRLAQRAAGHGADQLEAERQRRAYLKARLPLRGGRGAGQPLGGGRGQQGQGMGAELALLGLVDEGELVARRDQQPAPLVKRQAPLLPPQLFVALLHPDEGRRIDEHPVQGLLADPEIVIQLQQGSAHPAGS
ncbi:hypothetical protein D3C78_1054540 [compost metagenome]